MYIKIYGPSQNFQNHPKTSQPPKTSNKPYSPTPLPRTQGVFSLGGTSKHLPKTSKYSQTPQRHSKAPKTSTNPTDLPTPIFPHTSPSDPGEEGVAHPKTNWVKCLGGWVFGSLWGSGKSLVSWAFWDGPAPLLPGCCCGCGCCCCWLL